MSHSNSHHRRIRGRPPHRKDLPQGPQRECGQRRPRSPEATIRPTTPPRNSTDSVPTLITKSPHSNRTIKKGKLSGDTLRVPPPNPHNYYSTEPIQTHAPRSEPSTMTTPTTTLPDAMYDAQALLERLTAQLDSVLKTIDTLIQNNSDFAQLDTSHTKKALGQLNERLSPRAPNQAPASPSQHSERTHAPTQKKSYAEATSSTTTKGPLGPPRPHHKNADTKPVRPRHTDFGQLIVEFGGTVQQISPDKIKNELNSLFIIDGRPEIRVAGAQFSRKGRLILSVTPAISAQRVLATDWASATISLTR